MYDLSSSRYDKSSRNVCSQSLIQSCRSFQCLLGPGIIYPSTDLAQFHGTLFGFHPTALSVFTSSFFRISNFFDLSITEQTWVVEMHIWCIKIVNVLISHLMYDLSSSRCDKLHQGMFAPLGPGIFGFCICIHMYICMRTFLFIYLMKNKN
jgi:hypothetical protein